MKQLFVLFMIMGLVVGSVRSSEAGKKKRKKRKPKKVEREAQCTYAASATICGRTDEPIKIDKGAAIIFWVGRAQDASATRCTPGIARQGTLDVVFSKPSLRVHPESTATESPSGAFAWRSNVCNSGA